MRAALARHLKSEHFASELWQCTITVYSRPFLTVGSGLFETFFTWPTSVTCMPDQLFNKPCFINALLVNTVFSYCILNFLFGDRIVPLRFGELVTQKGP